MMTSINDLLHNNNLLSVIRRHSFINPGSGIMTLIGGVEELCNIAPAWSSPAVGTVRFAARRYDAISMKL